MTYHFPDNQTWFIKKMNAMGYTQASLAGQCHGIAYMAMRAFLLDDMETFYRRLSFIQIQPDSYFSNINKGGSGSFKSHSNDPFSPFDIQAFFEGVVLMQDPIDYQFLFTKDLNTHQRDVPASSLILSGKHAQSKAEMMPCRLRAQGMTDALTHEAFERRLELLTDSLGKDKVSIQLGAKGHQIVMNYTPDFDGKKCWSVVDAEGLSTEDSTHLTVEECAKYVYMKAFNRINYVYDPDDSVMIHSEIYTSGKPCPALVENLNQLQSSQAWISFYPTALVDQNKLVRAATKNGQDHIVERHIARGASDFGCENKSEVHSAINYKGLAKVKQLLARGANINEKDERGKTPLHRAAENGYYELADYFIDNGASISETDNIERTPLHLAVETGDLKMVTLFLDKGMSAYEVDKLGRTMLQIALDNNEATLIELFKKMPIKTVTGEVAKIKTELENYPTPLKRAALKAVKMLRKPMNDEELLDYKSKLFEIRSQYKNALERHKNTPVNITFNRYSLFDKGLKLTPSLEDKEHTQNTLKDKTPVDPYGPGAIVPYRKK